MTTATLSPELAEQQRVADAIRSGMAGNCCACRVILPLADMEPVPTRPWLVRCLDEDACRRRYTPRRLARSVRG